jgi:hypothetical protein
MKNFIDARQLDEMLDGFEQNGWLVKSSDGDFTSLGLTDAGMAEREVVFKRMANNLEGVTSSPPKICIAPELLSIIAQQRELRHTWRQDSQFLPYSMGGQELRNSCTNFSTSNIGMCIGAGVIRFKLRILRFSSRSNRSY